MDIILHVVGAVISFDDREYERRRIDKYEAVIVAPCMKCVRVCFASHGHFLGIVYERPRRDKVYLGVGGAFAYRAYYYIKILRVFFGGSGGGPVVLEKDVIYPDREDVYVCFRDIVIPVNKVARCPSAGREVRDISFDITLYGSVPRCQPRLGTLGYAVTDKAYGLAALHILE